MRFRVVYWYSLLGLASLALGQNNDKSKTCPSAFKKTPCEKQITWTDEDLADSQLDLFAEEYEYGDSGENEKRALLYTLGSEVDFNAESVQDVGEQLQAFNHLAARQGLGDRPNLRNGPPQKRPSDSNDDSGKKRQKGATHTYKFCKLEGEMTYKTPQYFEGSVLYDNENWKECNNYELVKGGEQQTSRKTKKYSGYIAEHILERQMIIHFAAQRLEGIQIPGRDDTENFCAYMSKYWKGSGSKDSKAVTVGGMQPMNYVASGWPRFGQNNNEMVRTEATINGVKARAFDSRKSIHADQHFTEIKNATMMELGHRRFKESVLVAKYMEHEDIQKYYYDQGIRIGKKWKKAEDSVKAFWEERGKTYQSLEIHKMWLEWLTAYTDEVHGKLLSNIARWWKVMMDYKEKKSGKARSSLPQDEQDLLGLLDAAVKEAEALKQKPRLFDNPFAGVSVAVLEEEDEDE